MNAVGTIEKFCLTASPCALGLFWSLCEAELKRRGVSPAKWTNGVSIKSDRMQIITAFHRGWDALTTEVMAGGGDAIGARKSLQEFQAGVARLAA